MSSFRCLPLVILAISGRTFCDSDPLMVYPCLSVCLSVYLHICKSAYLYVRFNSSSRLAKEELEGRADGPGRNDS